MPVIDYRCSLGHVESTFRPASQCGNDYPEVEKSKCSKCRRVSHRIYDEGAPTIGFTDKSGTSIVVHLNTKTGEYSIPGQRDDELPGRNYKRVAITSMKQYERVCKSVNATEREKAQFLQSVEKEYFDATAKQHREDTKQRVETAIDRGGHWVRYTDEKGITRTRWAPITPRARKLFDVACAQADRRREQLRQSRQGGSANFHSRIIEHRESERSIVDGAAKRAKLPNLSELMERMRR